MGSRSITLRLTLLFSIASTAVLLLVGLLIGRQVDTHFEALDRPRFCQSASQSGEVDG